MDATARRHLDQLEREIAAIALGLEDHAARLESIAGEIPALRRRLSAPLAIHPAGGAPPPSKPP